NAAGHAASQMLESQCGSCHHTSAVNPPNFLSGDSHRVAQALKSCAPRILVRLAMRELPSSQRAKSPMPPEPYVSETGIGAGARSAQRTDEKALVELRAAVETMLFEEYGRRLTPDELLRHGYESLRPCLPPAT
ncbi:MAG TPA: hypothetical protein VIT67_10125, partial [Povalibacter sp.]